MVYTDYTTSKRFSDMHEKELPPGDINSRKHPELLGLVFDEHEIDAFADMMRDESGLIRVARSGLVKAVETAVARLKGQTGLTSAEQELRVLVWKAANDYVQAMREADPHWHWDDLSA